MFKADAMQKVFELFDSQFSIRSRNRKQLASGELFWRATLVHINVSGFCADHCVIRLGYSLKTQDVRACSAEDKIDRYVAAEMFLEDFDSALREWIIAISNDVPLIRDCDGFEHFRMHACIIVAGKAAGRRCGSFHVGG